MDEVVRAKTTAVPAVVSASRLRVGWTTLALALLATGAAAYYAACGVLLHLSFHSFGWDLGIFDQVMWSITRGDGFHYSFRSIPYLGDHFQPMLALLAPLVWLGMGPLPILVVQGVAFGAAVVPLHAAVRRLAVGSPLARLAPDFPAPPLERKGKTGDTPAPPAEGAGAPSALPSHGASWPMRVIALFGGGMGAEDSGASPRDTASPLDPSLGSATVSAIAAWAISVAYVLSLGVARAVSYDWHPECFVPLLAFTALWGLAAKRPVVFAVATLALLPLKEDMGFLALGMCWVAWLGFGERTVARNVAIVAAAYTLVTSLVVVPLFAHGVPNPLVERYPYLGDNAREIAVNAVIRPDLIVRHLAPWEQLKTVGYLLGGVAFLPLLRPRLLPPLVVLTVLPMLSVSDVQRTLSLHYGVVPYAFSLVLAAMAVEVVAKRGIVAPLVLREPQDERKGEPSPPPLSPPWRGEGRSVVAVAGLVALAAIVLFAWKSPLPPSFAADASRYEVDHHSDVAQTFVDQVPDGVVASAQATYVPHLSERHNIYEFPRVEDSTYLIIDSKRDVPGYDAPAYEDCKAALSSIGFRVVREEDGISLYERSVDDAARLNGGVHCG